MEATYHGILAVMMFGILSAIGALIFSVTLLISMLSKIKNQKPLKSQKPFGFMIGSLVPFVTGLVCMYSVAAINDPEIRKVFDDFGCYIIMIIALAVMIYTGNRWRRKLAQSSL
jgi:hypothetical protein